MAKNESSQPSMDIQKHLSGLEFPASKQGIISHAKDKNAPQEFISTLNGLPDREYMDMDELMRELEMR